MFESLKGGLLPGSVTRTSLHAQGNTALATYCLDAPSDEALTTSKGRRFSQRDKTKLFVLSENKCFLPSRAGEVSLGSGEEQGLWTQTGQVPAPFLISCVLLDERSMSLDLFWHLLFFNGCNNRTFFTRLLRG